jgi:hypothetical protein
MPSPRYATAFESLVRRPPLLLAFCAELANGQLAMGNTL